MPQTVALVMIYLDMIVTVALEYSLLHNAVLKSTLFLELTQPMM